MSTLEYDIPDNKDEYEDLYDPGVQCRENINETDMFIYEHQPGVYFRHKNKLGQRCTNHTYRTPYCEYHLATHFGLAILPSGLLPDELGLYAVRDFPADSKICPYGGKRINVKQYKLEDKKGNKYILENIHNKTKTFWDAQNPTSSIARYANHGKGQCIFHSEANGKIYIVNEFPIEAGDEIFVNYGEDYWREEQFEQGSFLDSLTQPKPLSFTKYISKISETIIHPEDKNENKNSSKKRKHK